MPTTPFIKYSPDVETADPGFDENLQTVIAKTEAYITHIVPRQRLELPSYEAVVSALKEGYGVAAIGRYVVATELRSGSLTVVPVCGWDVRDAVSALRVREALLSPSAEQFQALVRERLAEISQRDDKRLKCP